MTETAAMEKVTAVLKFGKFNQSTLIISGDTPEEFAKNLAEMEPGLEAVVSIAHQMDAFSQEYWSEPPGAGEDLIRDELGGQVSGRKCQHGWMQLKSGVSSRGEWSAYMCPAPKGPGQCKPIDAKTGKPWG